LSGSWRTGSGRTVRPAKKLAEGAAGVAFTLADDPAVVFKLLSEPTQEDESRLKAMLQIAVPTRVVGASAAIAWPTDLVFDEAGRYAGFLMPCAPGPAPVNLAKLALRRERERSVVNLGWHALLAVCSSYAAGIAALHAFPIVVCDINLKNVVVSGDLTATVIDCDSTQIEAGGRLYGSGYFQDEFLAPELKRISDLRLHRREQTSDLWALAVLIWMVLMDGHHPFAGVWSGRGEPEQDEHAAAGRFPYASGSAPLAPSREAPPWRAIPRELQSLFVAAFTDGARRPEKRPTALQWRTALESAEGKLGECDGPLGRRHRFPAAEKTCPWCEYERYLGSSPFPKATAPREAAPAGASGRLRQPRPVTPTTVKSGTPEVRPRGPRTEELPGAAARGAQRIALGAAASLVLTLVLAILVTFDIGASFGAELAAAWHYVWLPLLLGAGGAWAGGFAHDVLQSGPGLRFWPDAVKPIYFALVGAVVCAAFIVGAASEGSVPPSAWFGFPLALCGAFLVTLVASVLLTRFGARLFAVPAALSVCLIATGAAWAAAPRSDLPSAAEQHTLDARLATAVYPGHCRPRAIAKLSPGLLRNSLDGLIFCRSGRIRGRFLAFRNDDLLEIYGSQQERKVNARGEVPARRCYNRGGAYSNTWFKQAHPSHRIGRLLCYGHRGKSVLRWEDPRDDLFGVIRGAGRRGNYHWWRIHSVGINWR
jgi:hypothetical protein